MVQKDLKLLHSLPNLWDEDYYDKSVKILIDYLKENNVYENEMGFIMRATGGCINPKMAEEASRRFKNGN